MGPLRIEDGLGEFVVGQSQGWMMIMDKRVYRKHLSSG
jgi:hypothetical protein